MYNNEFHEFNKINEPIKYKTETKTKKYNIHGVDYVVNYNNIMEYDTIKKQLATLSVLVED